MDEVRKADILLSDVAQTTKPSKSVPDTFLLHQATKMKMFKWSAETLDTDFTHRTRGIPSSDDSVLLELPGFADPNSSSRIQYAEDANVVAQQLLNCIRTWLDQ